MLDQFVTFPSHKNAIMYLFSFAYALVNTAGCCSGWCVWLLTSAWEKERGGGPVADPSASRSLELPVTTKGGLVWKRGLWTSRWDCYLHWYWNAFGSTADVYQCSTHSRAKCSLIATIYLFKQIRPACLHVAQLLAHRSQAWLCWTQHQANVISARPFLNDGKQDTVNVALANNVGKQSFMVLQPRTCMRNRTAAREFNNTPMGFLHEQYVPITPKAAYAMQILASFMWTSS